MNQKIASTDTDQLSFQRGSDRPKWPTFVAAGSTAIGVMWAAAFATRGEIDPKVGTTAWVAAAVIGASAVISAGAAERRQPRPPKD